MGIVYLMGMDLVDTMYIISNFISLDIDLDNLLETRPDSGIGIPVPVTPPTTAVPPPAPEADG